MTLKEYLQTGEKTRQELSVETGLSEASISRIVSGSQKASHEAMRALYAATRGKVTPNDFVGVAA